MDASASKPSGSPDWSKRVESLLRYYIQYKDSSTTKFNRFDEQVVEMHDNVAELFNKDYQVQYIHNEEGQWCATYPLLLVIITGTKGSTAVNSKHLIKETLAKGARFARVRTRFVVPVILFRGKNICRSSTLSHKLETVFQTTANSIKDSIFVEDEDEFASAAKPSSPSSSSSAAQPPPLSQTRSAPTMVPHDVSLSFGLNESSNRRAASQNSGMFNMVSASNTFISGTMLSSQANTSFLSSSPSEGIQASQIGLDESRRSSAGSGDSKEPSLMDRYRNSDIALLSILRITHICDLMVENAKKMMGVTVCSSEKKDSHNRYSRFSLNVMPYPGVEFFKEFSSADPQKAASMYFDWSRTVDPAVVSIGYPRMPLKWDDYKRWDLVTLTQNYLKLMLTMLSDTSCSGLLVHCISGWDRTPMMVSLLRLSLWADGEVHQSLSASEILYLTIAYDWMLYRHQLVHRQSRGEDIFFFCFYFLEFIKGKEFSVHYLSDSLQKDTDGLSRPDLSGSHRGATTLSSEAILTHSKTKDDYSPRHAKRNSLTSKLGGSLDDIHRNTGGLTSDLSFPMQPLRSSVYSGSNTSTPRNLRQGDDDSLDSDDDDDLSDQDSNGVFAPSSGTSAGQAKSIPVAGSIRKPEVEPHLSDDEYDTERLVIGDVEEGGSWQLVKERNFDTFMAEHLKNLPEIGTSPPKSVNAQNNDAADASMPPTPAIPTIPVSNHKGETFSKHSTEKHPSSAMSSPGSSPTMKDLAQRLHEEDLRWKYEERKQRLEMVRTEFIRLHEAHILPETAKLRSSIWSSWFSGFNFK